MMIGTDSHTPNAGGLGMVAIGVGGAVGLPRGQGPLRGGQGLAQRHVDLGVRRRPAGTAQTIVRRCHHVTISANEATAS
ncbi:MAG: hypothetical protein EBR23_12305, partial [Planctomycetia bacterium]|nr:hypothetical protein [Planctomycetia bacterium]